MLAANYSELRTKLKEFLDKVEDNNETVVIKRTSGKGSVLISLTEYNSLMETMHLLSSKKNAERLYRSIDQLNNAQTVNFNEE